MVDRWIAGHHWSNQDGTIISCGLVGELSFSETFNYSHRIDMFLIYSSPHLTREREREGADPVYCNCNKHIASALLLIDSLRVNEGALRSSVVSAS